MKQTAPFNQIALCILLCCANGCAAGLPWTRHAAQRPIPVSQEAFSQKAMALEKQGELPQALFAWRVAGTLDPDNESIAGTILKLEREMADTASADYQKGVDFFQKGDFDNARQAFLRVIHLNPEHHGARHYLKTRLHTTGHATYRVQRGDSFTKIANDIYKDVSKAYIIAYFNDLDPHRPLFINTLLVLPQLSPQQLLPRRDLLALIDQAQKALNHNRFTEVLSLTDRISAQSPGNVQARRLADAAHFGLAMARMEQKDYPTALESLQQVSPGYRGRDRAMDQARSHIHRQATEESLRSAQDRLDKGDFEAAIRISRRLIAREPGNRAARGIFEAANYALGKAHLDQGREEMAIEALSELDKNYQDAAQLLNQAYARRNARAENHYREGVMHFLKEDLELAIEAWEKSLALNPDHAKARQDIDNARRLLDKWHGLEQGK